MIGSERNPVRRFWVAAVLAALAPGLGQLYNTQARRALKYFFAWTIAAPLSVPLLLVAADQPTNVILTASFLLGLYLLGPMNAIGQAYRLGKACELRWYNNWLVYTFLVALYVTAVIPGQIWLLKAVICEAYTIPSRAMRDTIFPGDWILVSKLAYSARSPVDGRELWRRAPPRRGDIVAFRFADDDTTTFAKRVCGLPGETVEIQQERLYIDGRLHEEPYLKIDSFEMSRDTQSSCGPYRLDADQYFLLGDNRSISADSRYRGPVPLNRILGRACVVYWSIEPNTDAIRWERVGLRL